MPALTPDRRGKLQVNLHSVLGRLNERYGHTGNGPVVVISSHSTGH